MKHVLSGGLLSVAIAAGTIAPALSASLVTLKPAGGHPNQATVVTGSGFGVNEAVDVYVDTVDTLLLVSSSTGTLTGSVTIPASAQPGTHYVTAIGRHSGDAAQAAFGVSTPWAETGFGAARLGWNPYENTITTGNVASLGALWDIPANGAGGTPVVVSNRVFIGTNAGVEAVSSTTGALLWKAFPTSTFYDSPAVVGQTLYIGDSTNSLMYAINAVTGAKIWSQATGGVFESSPVVAGSLVYAGCVDGKIYAFATATGKIAWTYTTGSYIDSSPAVVNGVLYVGSADSKMYALNALTGALVWSYTTGAPVESSPAVSHGIVYFGSDDDKIYALNAAGGNAGGLLWSYTTTGLAYSSPAVVNGIVYGGSSDHIVYALNAHSGALQWSATTGGAVENVIVANGVVYASARDYTLYALAANYGGILATFQSGFSFLGNPTVSDGVLYFNGYGSDAYAFSLFADTNSVHAHAAPPPRASLHPDYSLVAHQ